LKPLAETLAECLEDILKGRAEIEACVQRYPERRQELLELLKLASRLPRLSEEEAQLSLAERRRILAAIEALVAKEGAGSSGGAQ